jgi:hypothetical protein
MRVTINMGQLNQALRDIETWTETKKQAVKDAVNESAINIQGAAKLRLTQNGNVDTGNLRANVIIEPASTDRMVLKVGTHIKYGKYIEWGTGKFATHPSISGRQTPWVYPQSHGGQLTGKMVFTHGSKPYPFLFPSAEEEKPNYITNVKEALKRD